MFLLDKIIKTIYNNEQINRVEYFKREVTNKKTYTMWVE